MRPFDILLVLFTLIGVTGCAFASKPSLAEDKYQISEITLERSGRELADETLDAAVAHRDYSVRFLLHGIICHDVYHAGQIAILRKGC